MLLVHCFSSAGALRSVQSYLVSMVLATYYQLNCIKGQHIFSVLYSPQVNNPCYSNSCIINWGGGGWLSSEVVVPVLSVEISSITCSIYHVL